MADRVGQKIGEYTLHETLGTDRCGTRYRATATATGDEATVRVIPPPTSDDRWFTDRVASTLRRYIGVDSPHLAALLAVGEANGAVYTVGPPLVGTSLRTRLGAPLPPTAVAALLGPIAAALDTIHGRYLVHGDLRPETILLTARGPILTDAGLAAAIADAARLSAGDASSPLADEAIYRAPEALIGGLADARADIYSLAVIAYEALTGQPPFRTETVAGSAGQRSTPPPTPPRERNAALSVAANNLLLRTLATSPYQRPATASELLAAFGPASADPATFNPATPSPAPAQAAQPAVPNAPSPPQRSSFTAPAPFAAPGWATPTPGTSASPPLAPTPAARPPAPAPRPAPEAAASAASGQQRLLPTAPSVAAPGIARARDTNGGSSGAYTYTSTPSFDAIAVPGDTAQQLVAGRTLLVNALAALARQRGAAPLTVERQHLVSALRAVTATPTPKGTSRTQATQELSPRMRQAARRPAPAERAVRYVDNWREVYSVPPQEALSALVKGSGVLAFGAIFGAMLFRDIRCVLLIVIVGSLGLLASWRSTTERAIICNADGFIVETGFFPWQRVGRFYRWSEIRAIRYHEANPRKSKNGEVAAKGVGHFAVLTPSGEVFDQTDAYTGFDLKGLVSRFAAQAPHLPYAWLPNDQVGTQPASQRVGRYSMVTRT